MQAKTNRTERIIGFDVLRAIMLFMLFVFHSGVSFMETTIDPEIWIYKNDSTNIIFDGILGFIHTFRHPTFFIISGFVTEMMYRRYPGKIVLKRRFQRLLIPFLITSICIGPFIYSLLAWLYGQSNVLSLEVMFPATENYAYSFGTSFIWFLYYLIIYNILHYFFHKLNQKPIENNRQSSQFEFYSTILILGILIGTVLFFWGENSLFGVYSFLPAFGSIGGYFLFYIIGIMLYRKLGDLDKIVALSWPFTILGFVFVSIYFLLGTLKINALGSTFDFDWGLMITSTISTILFSFGGIGLAIKYYTKPRKIISFISKSSYFLYLVHFPFVLIFLKLFGSKSWGALTKFSVVLSLTVIVALLLNYFWIKAWKNNPPI